MSGELFLSSTVGRDRINRFVQYFARFVLSRCQQSGAPKEALAQLAALIAAMGATRKVMRTGRQLEFFRGIVKSLSLRDAVVKATTILKSVFMAAWLTFDTCQWIHTAGIHKFNNIKEIGTNAFKCWLLALVFSLTGDIYKLQLNSNKLALEEKVAASGKGEESAVAKKNIKSLQIERGKLWITTVQDGVDVILPASGLEYIQIDSGWVGLAGAFTSLLGGCG
ncbi:peroxisomal biogenesis factor 11 [Obelidium mucronatum]|nr:peroxisomal biogenesis factor 11 [Obelidium mucronatum]